MSTEENKALSNRVAEAIGRADFDAFDELMAPELAEEFKPRQRDELGGSYDPALSRQGKLMTRDHRHGIAAAEANC